MPDKLSVGERILSAFYPERCAGCAKVIPTGSGLCADCSDKLLEVDGVICRKCARNKEECLCPNIRVYYSQAAAPFYYDGTAGKCIRRLKFLGKRQNTDFLARAMAKTAKARYDTDSFDLIAYVPMSKKSLKKRGFNQSFLLAEKVGVLLNIPVEYKALVKVYETPPQHKAGASLRRGNLAGVFDVPNPSSLSGKKILLCDDVLTTGSTLNECAKMLLIAGAAEVCCLTAAVTKKRANYSGKGENNARS